MIYKFLNNQSKTITGAAIILGAASLASRLLGLIRDRVLAHYFGAGPVMDSYYAAFKIPDLLYTLSIIGALSAGFIPIFTKIYLQSGEDKKEAWKLISNTINILAVALAAISFILIFVAPWLVPLIAPGFDGEKKEMTIIFTRIMLLSPILLGLSAVVGGVLQSLKNFFIYSLSPIFYNVGIIIGAVALVPLFGYKGLAMGVILGAFLHLLIQLPSLWRAGFRYSPIFNWRDQNFLMIIRLMIPRTLGLAALQLNMVFITAIASTLSAGAVTIFNYAYNLQSFSLGVVGVSFAVAALPTLSALAAEKNWPGMIKDISSVARQILFFIIPMSVIFLMLRAQIVRVILGSGEFDWDATVRTADTLAFFSLSLFAQCLSMLLARAFYAMEDTKTPLKIGVVTVIVNIALSLYFTRSMGFGVEGLALAFTLAWILNTALFWIALRFRLGSLDEENVLRAVYKMSVAALLMGLAIQGLKYVIAPIVNMETFLGIFAQGALAGLGGLAVYAIAGLALRSHEMCVFIETIKKRLVRRANLPRDVSGIGEV
ncbi:MAG: Integral membrane protein MviN [Candidatus Magasanikbacteria bacterium GW2011_GWC2_41_17]|uniref:Probable lipid II flippase MurJ n=2 Tax=Candidatus Magasanikiibacteriota TaxID=1752731 RepID=A0A0G0VDD0_9BACT|nr:MAG: Integral membrane protein MviN [Candidatus Magasanikbacteria bacterium GW2011_GWC2_41_17]